MPAPEFVEWQAYFSIYPFTQDREDLRIALLAATISNVSGRTVKRMREVQDFLPNYLQSPTTKTIDQQRAGKELFKQKLQAAQKR